MTDVLHYPLDLTGTLATNKVVDEPYALVGSTDRILVLANGPFFTESLVLVDANRVLIRDTDYGVYQLHAGLTARTGKEVAQLIVVTNDAVTVNVQATYQLVGGPYVSSAKKLSDSLIALNLNDQAVDYNNLVGMPIAFNPTHHLHEGDDLYGCEYIVEELKRLDHAVSIGFDPVLDNLRATADNLLTKHIASGDHNSLYYLKPETYSSKEYDDLFLRLSDAGTSVSIVGPLQVRQLETASFRITNFDNRSIYQVTMPGATIDWFQSGADPVGNDSFNITPPSSMTPGDYTYTIKCGTAGRILPLRVLGATTVSIATPTISGTIADSEPTVTLAGSAFTTINGADTATMAEIIGTNDSTGVVIIDQTFNASNGVLPSNYIFSNLPLGVGVSFKIRYKGITSDWSAYSNPTTFTTKITYVVEPPPVIVIPPVVPEEPPVVVIPMSVNTPTVTAVMSNTDPIVTIDGSVFGTTNGTDTYAAYSYKVTNTSNGTVFKLVEGITASGTKAHFDVSGLSVSTSYEVTIRYRSANGTWSAWSSIASFFTKSSYAPPVTVNTPTVTAVMSIYAPTVTIHGGAIGLSAGLGTLANYSYKITDTTTGAVFAQSAGVTASDTSAATFDVANLPLGHNFSVSIQYMDINYGWSAWSAVATFSTLASYAPTPFQVNFDLPVTQVWAPVTDNYFYQEALLFYFNVPGYTSDQFDVVSLSNGTWKALRFEAKGIWVDNVEYGGTFTKIDPNAANWASYTTSNPDLAHLLGPMAPSTNQNVTAAGLAAGSVKIGSTTYTPFRYISRIVYEEYTVEWDTQIDQMWVDTWLRGANLSAMSDSTLTNALARHLPSHNWRLNNTGVAFTGKLRITLKKAYWPVGNYTYY